MPASSPSPLPIRIGRRQTRKSEWNRAQIVARRSKPDTLVPHLRVRPTSSSCCWYRGWNGWITRNLPLGQSSWGAVCCIADRRSSAANMGFSHSRWTGEKSTSGRSTFMSRTRLVRRYQQAVRLRHMRLPFEHIETCGQRLDCDVLFLHRGYLPLERSDLFILLIELAGELLNL